MKYVIPLGALLLLGFVASLHRVVGRSDRPSLEVQPRRDAGLGGSFADINSGTPALETRKAEPSIPTSSLEPVAKTSKGNDNSWRKLQTSLCVHLSLSSVQQESLERILRSRSEEIQACHEEIRKARVLDVQQYEWQVARMKESWFRRIDSFLDGKQRQKFVSLVEEGIFNEGLGITQEPGMTILD